MNSKIIRLSEQFLIIGGLQLFALHYLKTSVMPSFFLIWLLILVWEGNKETALVLAFAAGIVYDIIARGFPGSTSVIFLLIVYINCFIKPKSLAGKFAAAFVFSYCYFLFSLFEHQRGFVWNAYALLKYSFLFAFYNALILYVIEIGMRKLRWKGKKEYLSIL